MDEGDLGGELPITRGRFGGQSPSVASTTPRWIWPRLRRRLTGDSMASPVSAASLIGPTRSSVPGSTPTLAIASTSTLVTIGSTPALTSRVGSSRCRGESNHRPTHPITGVWLANLVSINPEAWRNQCAARHGPSHGRPAPDPGFGLGSGSPPTGPGASKPAPKPCGRWQVHEFTA